MKKELLVILIIFSSLKIFGQEVYTIDSSFSGMGFIEFADHLQEKYGLTLYFNESNVDSVTIGEVDDGATLEKIFSDILPLYGLNYFKEDKDIYIYPGRRIITNLPEYETFSIPDAVTENDSENKEEEKYLQTQRISEKRFITIGDKKHFIGDRKYLVIGNIKNKVNGEPLVGATVFVKETQTGVISDTDGNFELRLNTGLYSISVNHMAMKEMQYGLNVLSSGKFSIELEHELIELEEVTVSDKRQDNVKGMLMGFDRITTKSIKEIPVVMGEKDILKVAQMLPGVQNVGEGASGINVRGGSADQNMFYINRISVYNTSHLFGFFTAFSPDIISDFSLYKNNIPSKYGGRISSIIEITTRPGNKNNFFAQGGVSPITGHIEVEGPIVKEKVSVVASFRSTYSDWLLKRVKDNDIRNSNASFYDATIGADANINSNNQLKLFYYQSHDDFSLSTRNDYQYSNLGGSLRWKHSFSKYMNMEFSVAKSKYDFSNIDKNNISEAFSHAYRIDHTETRLDFVSTKLTNHRFEYGINGIYYFLDRGNVIPYGPESTRIPIELGSEQGLENSVYLSDEFRIFPRLNVLTGIRYSLYNMPGPAEVNHYTPGEPKDKFSYVETVNIPKGQIAQTYSGFEPRIAFNFSTGKNSSLKASYNRLQQYLFLLSNTIAVAPTDQWKLTDPHIEPPVSEQVSMGYYQDFKGLGLSTSLEVYKKWTKNVVEYKDGASFISSDPIETLVLQGLQDSKGVELMIKKNKGDLTGWLSYTYSRSIVEVKGDHIKNSINSGKPYPSNFDRPHSLNLVSNYRVSRRVSFSTNVVYMSGRPVTLPVGAYFSEDVRYLLYSDRNEYRLPDYFRIDFSMNLEGNLKYKKLAHSYWMLNVYNLTGRNNAYSVFYESEPDRIHGYMLSIFAQPIITVSWNFKFGNYNSE